MPRTPTPRIPWITPDGYLDMTKLPLESCYQQALSEDPVAVRSALHVLQSATAHDRPEAGVFLMGLLVHAPPEDWESRCEVAEALRVTHTRPCAALLFSELRRVKSSNTTRRYLGTVLKTLAHFPRDLVREGLESLAADPSFSYRLRAKFRAVAAGGLDGLR